MFNYLHKRLSSPSSMLTDFKMENRDGTDLAAGYLIGKKHARRREAGQDYSDYFVSESRTTVAISDGCTGVEVDENAVAAARLSVEFALTYMQECNWCDWTTEEFLENFSDSLQQYLGDSGRDYSDLSATLAVVSFDKKSGNYMVINIGDGMIFSYNQNYLPKIISYPMNRDGDSSRTYFGNDPQLKDFIQVFTGNASEEGYAGFLLCSDGAQSLVSEISIVTRLAFALKNRQKDDIKKILFNIRESTTDDVSVAMFLLPVCDSHSNRKNEHRLGGKIESDIAKCELELEQFGFPIRYGRLIMKALQENDGLSYEELVNQGICAKGTVLQSLLPLIKIGLVTYKNKLFIKEYE